MLYNFYLIHFSIRWVIKKSLTGDWVPLTSLLRQPSTITCCDRFDWNCVNIQARTSNTHRAELIENAQMVDPIKSCTEVNLHDLSLLSTLQCILQCMGHAQKCITGTQTFPISKLGGWKDTTAFHKSSKTNRHQVLKHLRQYWCYGNWSVICNRRGWWTFRNWGDISLFPASQETTQTNKPPKHYTKMGAITSAVLLRKRGNIPNLPVPP